jgi:site-specific DNA recombinase
MTQRVARSGRAPHRADLDGMAVNPHPQTKNTYKLRSYVWCTPASGVCTAMRPGTERPTHTASPAAGPCPKTTRRPFASGRTSSSTASRCSSTVTSLGPDRLALAQASLPAANDLVRDEHLKAEAVLRQKLAEIDGNMTNLMRVLERTSDPHGQLYQRTERRMAELGQEFAEAEARLRKHVASTPPEPEQNAGLLEHLPQLGVDLNLLPPERLRRFLEAFRVEIRYDVRTGRATFKAEISAKTIEELAQLARQAEATRWRAASSEHHAGSSDREGPAAPGGTRMIIGGSFSECPREESNPR